jgi:hypothetical protein
MSGKGSKPRPLSVDRKTFESNWDRIFANKNKHTNCGTPKCCGKCQKQ